ncbi:MAG: GumC family protein [Bacillota bacterium]
MEGLNLRVVIEVMLKWKKVIGITTLIFVVIALFVNVFLLSPVYQAQTMLLISPVTKTDQTNRVITGEVDSFEPIVGSLSNYPQMTIDTYREQIKAPEVLDYIRKEMNINEKSISSIADSINVKPLKNTNLISIGVTDKDPAKAAKMANLISERYTKFISEVNQKQAEQSAEFLKKQMEEERNNLTKASDALKEFLKQPRGPEEVKQELASKLEKLTEFKTKLSEIKIMESSKATSLQHAKQLLKKTPSTVITVKSILDDELLSEIVKSKTDIKITELSRLKLTSEEINQVYVSLSSEVNTLELEVSSVRAERSNMENEISLLQKDIEVLQADLAEKQQKYDILNNEVNLIKQTYETYQKKYKEVMIIQSAEIGKSSIMVVSKATPPRYPIGPNKAKNIIIASIFGFMLSSLAVFLIEYWEGSKSNYLSTSK